MMLTDREIDGFVKAIVRRTQAEKVIVFGSYAKGNARQASDLDILVIARTPLPMARRLDALLPIFQWRLFRVDVHVYTPAEVEAYSSEPLSFISSVLKTGRVVYECPAARSPEADRHVPTPSESDRCPR